ncbi:hypothetical protein ACJX0J_011177, partial [Zea mays]
MYKSHVEGEGQNAFAVASVYTTERAQARQPDPRGDLDIAYLQDIMSTLGFFLVILLKDLNFFLKKTENYNVLLLILRKVRAEVHAGMLKHYLYIYSETLSNNCEIFTNIMNNDDIYLIICRVYGMDKSFMLYYYFQCVCVLLDGTEAGNLLVIYASKGSSEL